MALLEAHMNSCLQPHDKVYDYINRVKDVYIMQV